MTYRRMLKGSAFQTVVAVLVVLGALVIAFDVLQDGTQDHGGDGATTGSGATVLEGSTASNTPRAATPSATDEAPEFEINAMDGSTVRSSALRGSVVVVNFWATWCTPCRVEIPDLIEIHEELMDVRIIGVSLDEEGFEVVRPFAEVMGIPYPLVMGDEDVASAFGGVAGLPTTYVIDREWRIRQRFVGMVNRETLVPVLTELVEKRVESGPSRASR